MAIAVKKHAKSDITFLKSCPILLYFVTLCQIFCTGFQFSYNKTFLDTFLNNLKHHWLLISDCENHASLKIPHPSFWVLVLRVSAFGVLVFGVPVFRHQVFGVLISGRWIFFSILKNTENKIWKWQNHQDHSVLNRRKQKSSNGQEWSQTSNLSAKWCYPVRDTIKTAHYIKFLQHHKCAVFLLNMKFGRYYYCENTNFWYCKLIILMI